ncbi:MAG TPA: cytochrome c oxidase subunit II [Pirellulales bacterium]|jgi:cytochrome c oxidase subunit 2|nr:cytochrome c oxidase subunit II [Pirellulales bacterium]
MDTGFRIHPEQASTAAPQVDALYFFLLGVSIFFTVLIAGLIVYFAIRFRQSAKTTRRPMEGNMALEITWIVVPLVIVTMIFFWSMSMYYDMSRIPEDALEIHVVAKQWMWKFQHPLGRREIDTLHVPAGRAVKLTMISQDVIHSFFVPAFRVKQDVLPGRYSRTWFEATEPGEYHLFCAEYCGTSHSQMIGRVVVMPQAEYQTWLAGGPKPDEPQAAGEALFARLRCGGCHGDGREAPKRGPLLAGVFERRVPLQSGTTVTADEDYLRQSILRPDARLVAGFEPMMPSYQGQLGEEEMNDLIAYLKSLGHAAVPAGANQP